MGRFTVLFAAVLLGARYKKAQHPPFVISQNNHPISPCPTITSASAKVPGLRHLLLCLLERLGLGQRR